uniref:Potassium channel domain-containing protein n=1 Tax=Meloidogyne enterolobii TaxID=390850 RepID=A0A6V7W6C1_MELEN|nr:unnamed protein product [Meloidogyne enterolobii]
MQNIGQHKYHYYFYCLPEGEEEQLHQQTSNYMGENRINYGYEWNETNINSTPPIFTLKFLPSSSFNIFGEGGGGEGNFKTWSGGAGVSAITVNNNELATIKNSNENSDLRKIGRFVLQKSEDEQPQTIIKENKISNGRELINNLINNNIKERSKYFDDILSQQKSLTIFQQYARFHNQFGIRHVLLILLLVLYAIFGGLMFQAIERDNEIENVHTTTKIIDKLIIKIKNNISMIFFIQPTTKQSEKINEIIVDGYTEMLKIEGRYIGSVFHKYETLALNNVLNWYFGSSVFYGYGTIACQTALGKFASIVYALFGIPMMLMVLGDVGQLILGFLLYCRKSVREYYRRWLLRAYVSDIINEEDIESKIVEKNKLEEGEGEEEEDELSLSLLLPIVAIYILFVSTIVSLLDWSKDGKFFLSLATIGLGDVMPYNLQYTPLLAFLFLAGLALLSLVNSTIYVRLQNRFLAIMDCLEDFLEKVQYNNQKSLEGYFTFISLAPSIKFLATALPLNFLQDEKQQNNLNNTTNQRHKRCRSKSMNAVGDRRMKEYNQRESHQSTITTNTASNFRPTLGVMTAATSPRISRQSTFNVGGTTEFNNFKRRRMSKDGGQLLLNRAPVGDMRKRATTISHDGASVEDKNVIKLDKRRTSIDNERINIENGEEEEENQHHQLLLSAKGLLLRWADQQQQGKEEEEGKEEEKDFYNYYYVPSKPTTSMQRRIYSRRGSRDVGNNNNSSMPCGWIKNINNQLQQKEND